MHKVYLDYSATTPVRQEVAQKVGAYLTDIFGNPSSIHFYGREARKSIEYARKQIAKVINANPEEIIFTSGGTEADNMAVIGAAMANQNKGRHLITTQIEHHAVLDSFKYLEKIGFEVTYLAVDENAMLNIKELEKNIKSDTILISIMHVNNEVGTILPIEEIGKITRENNILFHVDAVQSFGKLPLDVNKMNIDLLSASGHKIYAPKGSGCLFLRKGVKIEPHFFGGAQERKHRPGTENVPAIIGFGLAAELARNEMDKEIERLTYLRERLITGILEKIPYVKLNADKADRLPSIVNVSIEFVEGESLLLMLDINGIAASSGSACTSGSLEPSHVLLAMGISHEFAQGSLRFSLGKDTTVSDIDYVLKVLPEIVQKLRQMSPFFENIDREDGNNKIKLV